MQLQQGLSKIIGSEAMKVNGGIDGKFGPGTVNALKMAGYGATVDEPTFNKIVIGNLIIVFDPKDIATTLYRNASLKDINGVLLALRRIKTASEYSQVNSIYKEIPIIGKTIVTDLLDYSFKTNDAAKQLVKSEFLRIGLKISDTGKWSLQGFRLFKDIITLRDTVVTDPQYNKVPVKKNTILGEEVVNENGMTWFKSVDNTVLQVPTQDIKYT